MTGLSVSHALHCRVCGLFGHRARARARQADERLLVAFHRHVAALVRAERRAKVPPWQTVLLEALKRDAVIYFGDDWAHPGDLITGMPRQW